MKTKDKPVIMLSPNQTDLFGSEAFTGCNVVSETIVPKGASADPGIVLGNASSLGQRPTQKPPSVPGSEPTSQMEAKHVGKVKPVAKKRRKKLSRALRVNLSERQAKRRAIKKRNGLRRLETWVPQTVRDACRIRAKSKGTTVDAIIADMVANGLIGTAGVKGAV